MREMRVTATQTGESVTELIFCEDMSAMDGGGFEVVLDIRDGRTVADVGEEDEVDAIEIVNPLVESQKENTRVSIRPLPGRRNEFTVDFSTRHYAFSCCRSQTVRSLESFYQLHTILKVSLRTILKVRLRNILATFFLLPDVPPVCSHSLPSPQARSLGDTFCLTGKKRN